MENKTEINEVEVNGIKYVRKGSESPVLNKDGYVIARCQSAGVFMGHLIESDMSKGTCTLQNARRIWYWAGAASLSQLAMEGTSTPKDCKFPIAVTKIMLGGVVEIIPCTEKAVNSINSVPVWKM